MKSNARLIFASALVACSLSAAHAAASPAESKNGLVFKYAEPVTLAAPAIHSLAVCPADDQTLEGAYDPSMVVQQLKAIPGFKAVETSVNPTEASDRQKAMTSIAGTAGTDAVLYVQQKGKVTKESMRGGLVNAQINLKVKLSVQVYIASTDTMLTQEVVLLVPHKVGIGGRNKGLTDEQIRQAVASDLISKLLPSASETKVASID